MTQDLVFVMTRTTSSLVFFTNPGSQVEILWWELWRGVALCVVLSHHIYTAFTFHIWGEIFGWDIVLLSLIHLGHMEIFKLFIEKKKFYWSDWLKQCCNGKTPVLWTGSLVEKLAPDFIIKLSVCYSTAISSCTHCTRLQWVLLLLLFCLFECFVFFPFSLQLSRNYRNLDHGSHHQQENISLNLLFFLFPLWGGGLCMDSLVPDQAKVWNPGD